MKNGKKYTQLNLSKDMGVSRQMANTHFKRLKELGIIAEVFTTKGKLMAVNPNVCMVGESVPERIIELFKDTKYSKAMMAKVGINI